MNPKLPIHSVKELIEYPKAHPGELSFASGSTAGIVGGYTLERWAEISMLHVPYKTTGPALEDIISGRVSMMLADLGKAPRLRDFAREYFNSAAKIRLPAGVTATDQDSNRVCVRLLRRKAKHLVLSGTILPASRI